MARSIAMPTYQGARAGVERERESFIQEGWRELGGESARERGMKIIAIGAEWV